MSPLHCNTVREALWERAASPGPASLAPTLAEHLTSCPGCQAERRAVRELVETSRSIPDPEPPADLWDGFMKELAERIEAAESKSPAGASDWHRWAARITGIAAVLALGFALGVLADRSNRPDQRTVEARQAELVANIQAELANDARLEAYLGEIEELLVAYRAAEHGEAVDVFRRSLPTGMVAGPGAPSEGERQRLEAQRAAREQLRTVVLGMLASEIEAERRGFGYLDRRIAEIAGQRLLYIIH